MLFFFLIVVSLFLFTLYKSLPLRPLPSWATELTLVFVFLCQELLCFFIDWLTDLSRLVNKQIVRRTFTSTMASPKKSATVVENVVESEGMINILDLPELALECILQKLPPAGLCNMACVCKPLRQRCTSDCLWERHMREKWGRIIGPTAHKGWKCYVDSRMDCSGGGTKGDNHPKGWIGQSFACVWPLSWFNSKLDNENKAKDSAPMGSIMSWYLALESGKFWFPAQVYNRENGCVGFMLSCYDAEVSYDCRTDTFTARYVPHGRRGARVEEGVQWNRLRASPVHTPPLELHTSDCLNDLRPGDHVEIQWRKNKEYPYGWWYGVVGHLESCDHNERYCHCNESDAIIFEFNQYSSGSRWRRTSVDRKEHREVGNETDGFYGGIRKLHSEDEISTWKRLWPTEAFE